MDAPVVPRRLARETPPVNRKRTLASGVASPLTVICIPPETTNSEPIMVMKLMYSCAGFPDAFLDS